MDLEQWKQALSAADDDYLTGLCNKGTVKRAYKERPDIAAEIMPQDDGGFTVKVGEETCRICLPLGDSRCSCVSRSICKHIIIAVLCLRDYVREQERDGSGAQPAPAAPEPENGAQSSAPEVPEMPGTETSGTETVTAGTAVSGPDTENTESAATGTVAEEGMPVPEETEKKKAAQPRVFPEIRAFPLEKARKAMGVRRYQSMVSRARLRLRPQIEVTSVITVTFPDTGIRVKLLEPLAHAACSCHKKSLCGHKAEAILWYQLECGVLTPEQLDEAMEETSDVSLDAVHGLADAMMQLLEMQLRTGLARTSPDVLDSLERMAILCHNQELADFERDARSLRTLWQNYFDRMASFRTEDLMVRVMMFYQKARSLRETATPAQIRRMAGQFKSAYQPVGDLTLIGIGVRRFISDSGYEGETCYFLEESGEKWYTYTNARPLFYDHASRRKPGAYAKAPWELRANAQELTQLRIRLHNARVNEKNRISSSAETHGEILGARNIRMSEIAGWYYTDFRRLFEERIRSAPVPWMPEGEQEYGFDESRRPVLVQASACRESEFDRIAQTFRLDLLDANGVLLAVEVVYSKEEDFTIRYLERVARRIQASQRSIPCFVGDVYLSDGQMKLYPITFLEPKEIDYDH